MNKRMDASKHPTKGLCAAKGEPVHKVNDIERRLAKALTVPGGEKKES